MGSRYLYLSGPMTGIPEYNYPYFNRVADAIRTTYNDRVFNPAEAFEGNTDLPRDTYLRHDIETLLYVDAIVLLPGWETSKGALLELWIARELTLDIWKWDDERGLLFRMSEEELISTVRGSTVSGVEAAALKNGSCCCKLPS
jgi:hypothetical protein